MTIIDQWMRLRNIVESVQRTHKKGRGAETAKRLESRNITASTNGEEKKEEKKKFLVVNGMRKECNMQLIWLSGFRCTQFIFFILAGCSLSCRWWWEKNGGRKHRETRLPSHLLIKTKCSKITLKKSKPLLCSRSISMTARGLQAGRSVRRFYER